jgi:hypothetical protein
MNITAYKYVCYSYGPGKFGSAAALRRRTILEVFQPMVIGSQFLCITINYDMNGYVSSSVTSVMYCEHFFVTALCIDSATDTV